MTTPVPTDVVLRPVVRFTLYLVGAIGSVVVAYTTAKGWTGDAEVVAWGGVVAIIQGLAAANVPSRPTLRRRARGEAGVLVSTQALAVFAATLAVVCLLLILL
ncbi:holin protein [Pseudanabaena phage Pam4]|nr:holin protein [Pseudanabaena phage Pam4]